MRAIFDLERSSSCCGFVMSSIVRLDMVVDIQYVGAAVKVNSVRLGS